MSAFNFAKQAFGREKPHSSVTDWVDILTAINIEEEAYDGIPELIDSINLQASGPAEASRALRKKLKHGNSHQQYRSLVLLKALVENIGQKFASTFSDGHMTDALKNVATDPATDRRVRKKLTLVLALWRDQYRDQANMTAISTLYKQCIGPDKRAMPTHKDMADLVGLDLDAEERRRAEKREAKKKIMEANRAAKEQRELHMKKATTDKSKPARVPFDFEKDKPKVLASIVEASQASNNLQNAIQLVNLEVDQLETNPRVQECLEKAKQARRPVVRYIQLVENEDLIGTLIEANDRIVAALEQYEQLCATAKVKAYEDANALATNLASVNLSQPPSEAEITKGKDRDATGVRPSIYSDLEDINFGALGSSTNNLPPPMRPSTLTDDADLYEDEDHRPTLSDYSDYSSDEETHKKQAASSSKRNYVTVSDDEEDDIPSSSAKKHVDNDPFADPFADK